jgi:hypothetical protein
VQSGSRAKGGSFCNFCWPFGNCKERQHILPFHPGWTVWTQTKRQGTNSPASKKPCAQQSKTKTVLITFFDCKGVVHEVYYATYMRAFDIIALSCEQQGSGSA